MAFLSANAGAIGGFVVGCIVWNYFSPTIKSWLHMKESAVGAWIKAKIGRAV